MSEQLKRSTMTALKEAYAGYLNRDWEIYTNSLHVARTEIDEIRSLGRDPDRMGREIEVLYLTGEELLVTAFTFLGKPWEMRMYYELAAYYMTVFSSNILTKESRFLPEGICLTEEFPLPDTDPEEAMKEFSEAMKAYGNITDGGGKGVDELYRAAIYWQLGEAEKAFYHTKLARTEGGEWIQACADEFEEQMRSAE
ncbi:MAG: hypothetical protein LUE29_06850 [Lachnospiraceae bacterium]|nr:hypothetical protein [Lachnospiraceae bacterium]